MTIRCPFTAIWFDIVAKEKIFIVGNFPGRKESFCFRLSNKSAISKLELVFDALLVEQAAMTLITGSQNKRQVKPEVFGVLVWC